jgi:hypothetical protein
VLLAVFAGLGGGVAMATVAAGRRTATVYDRFAAHADVPELLLNFCPPDLEELGEGDLDECFTYQATDERDALAALPEVDAVSRVSFRGLTVAKASSPEETTVASTLLTYDPGLVGSIAGRYLVVDGRDAEDVDEVVLNEVLARRSNLKVGDRAVITFWDQDELGVFGADGAAFGGPARDVEIVGIGRALTDLASAQVGFGADEAAIMFGARGLAASTDDAGGFTGVLVDAAGDDADAARSAIQDALADRSFNVAPALGDDEIEPTRDAIRYEAHATTVVGSIVALLAVVFVGQAVTRQSRREWREGPVLRAVGVVTREAVVAAGLRGAAIGVPAAVIAVATAVVLSPRGPVGVGRRAEVDTGIRVDMPVLVAGAGAAIVLCAVSACVPLLRGRALRTAPPTATSRTRGSLGLPPVPSAGLHLARTRMGAGLEAITALVGTTIAVVAIVAASCLTASFDDLAATPARFGAPWDVSVGASLDGTADVEAVLGDPELRRSIDGAAVITGTDLRIGDETAWVHAYAPLASVADEAVPLPIGTGRPPANAREIALGALTMDAAGVSIGDTVTVDGSTTGRSFEMTVVGTTMVNDNFEASPGRGGAVTPEFIAEAAPEITGDPVIVSLTADADVDAFTREVRARYDGAVEPPLQQAAVRNVGRIRGLPYLVAAVVAVLAIASLAHALVLAVGHNRRMLGMLKGLGFTRRQIGATVAWHAMSYAAAALVVALPLGVLAGRWSWRAVADSLGVPAVPIVPLGEIALVAGALLVVAAVIAAYPGWRAGRLSTAAALRAE